MPHLPIESLLGSNSRVTVADCDTPSVATQFYNAPIQLPPLLGTTNLLMHKHFLFNTD